MRRSLVLVAACVLAGGLAACSAKSGGEGAAPPAQAARPIPPDSPLAKVKTGMTTVEVQTLLGAPTSQNNFESGKRWIPYYYGNDVRRTEWAYKGLGRVLFTGGNQWGGGAGLVERVEYDPNETGVRAD